MIHYSEAAYFAMLRASNPLLFRYTMNPMLNMAVRAARKAGDIILRYVDRVDRLAIASKSNHDFVSEVDHKAEQAIIDVLRTAYPDHGIFAEESGASGNQDEFQWIIDPLDGTTNYLHGLPQFAVSIALKQRKKLMLGVIYDPMRNDLYTAVRGDGALLNDKRIRASQRKEYSGVLLGTGFPYTDQSYMETYLETFKALVPDTAGIRRPGSAALDLAYVAAGRYDGFWEFNLNAWDIAAGVVLVREAGGIVSDFEGRENFLQSGDVIAGGARIFPEMFTRINKCITASDYLTR